MRTEPHLSGLKKLRWRFFCRKKFSGKKTICSGPRESKKNISLFLTTTLFFPTCFSKGKKKFKSNRTMYFLSFFPLSHFFYRKSFCSNFSSNPSTFHKVRFPKILKAHATRALRRIKTTLIIFPCYIVYFKF